MGIGGGSSGGHLWWQKGIEWVLDRTEVRVAEGMVGQGAENITIGQRVQNGMGKTLGHRHQATGAFARIPLNPKVKEPRIFFAQIKSARLLIEEGLGEVEDLIKILIATRERLQILGKREIRRTVAVKPGALGSQPAIVWRTVVAHLRVNKGGEPWNLPKIKAKAVGRLG